MSEPVDDDVMEIRLGGDNVCLIDAADWDLVKDYRWHAHSNPRRMKLNWYARAYGVPDENGVRRSVSMHRFICKPPRQVILDHINGNGLDNRRENLRFSNNSVNQANRVKRSNAISSKYKGVTRKGVRYVAAIAAPQSRHLGTYDNEIRAALAYDVAAIETFGEHALTNFPPEIVAMAMAGLATGQIL